jgi:CDP-glucose 4,6-dehydratase
MEGLALRLPDRAFWPGQRVLLTGHTGFKGAWASLWLERLGADVAGIALPPDQVPNLHELLAPFARHRSHLCDLCDHKAIRERIAAFQPTLVLHMAAQALVRRSYAEPVETYATNVMGTVHLLDAVRSVPSVRAVLVVTTDKVYANQGDGRSFNEDDRLGGHDPYSASKAAAELVTQSFHRSFLGSEGVAVATARAGNVIGGGDWSADRLVPDVWRAHRSGIPLALRYPSATRPWQHVLDPLLGYLLYLEDLATGRCELPPTLNFGPLPGSSTLSVADVAEQVSQAIGMQCAWVQASGAHPPEMPTLALDARRAVAVLGWHPRLDPERALRWTAEWYRAHDAGDNMRATSSAQLARYEEA